MADKNVLHRHRFGGLTHRHDGGDTDHSHGTFGGDTGGWGPVCWRETDCAVCRHSIEACTCPMGIYDPLDEREG